MHRGKMAMVYFYATEHAKVSDHARKSTENPNRRFAGSALTVTHLHKLIHTPQVGFPIVVIELIQIGDENSGREVTFEQAKRELEVFDTESDF